MSGANYLRLSELLAAERGLQSTEEVEEVSGEEYKKLLIDHQFQIYPGCIDIVGDLQLTRVTIPGDLVFDYATFKDGRLILEDVVIQGDLTFEETDALNGIVMRNVVIAGDLIWFINSDDELRVKGEVDISNLQIKGNFICC